MKITKFEDLLFWQKARELTKLIYSFTKNGKFVKDFGLKDQIQRSSVSVMSNIAEGFGRGGNKEFRQFLFVARGSLAEVQSQLYVSKDLNYITDEQFVKAYDMAEEVSRLMNAFSMKMNSNGKNLKDSTEY